MTLPGVLVTGAGGQLGTELVKAFSAAGAYTVRGATRAQLDVGDRDAVHAAIGGLSPAIIVHAAAWTAVDDCERDPGRAWRDNALAARHLAEAAQAAGAYLCYLSTDYVFSGDATRPYTEWDDPGPASVYGRSKLGGEREVAAGCPGASIVRTSWLCGVQGANVVKTILRLSTERAELRFVDDQWGCPTFADDLAAAIVRLASYRLPGIWHATNQGPTTWFGFARDVVGAAGGDPGMVCPVATAELVPQRLAPRPLYSVLDNAALRAAGLPLLADYHEPLARTVATLIGESA